MFQVKCLSIFLIPIFIYCGFYFNRYFHELLKTEFTIGPNARWYNDWENRSIPVVMKFYFYNWTNVDKFHDHTENLNFSILGPYTFTETKRKVNVTWSKDTVFYEQLKHWYFDDKASSGNLSDLITNVNVLIVCALHITKFQHSNTLNWLISYENQFSKTATVEELLFLGYEDFVLNLGNIINKFNIIKVPEQNRFGWFYNRNGSTNFEGVFEVKRFGGEIVSWNGKSKTDFFPSTCSEVRGSAGEIWPFDVKQSYIEMFSPDLCKSIRLNFKSEAKKIKGINGVLYEADKYLFDNGQYFNENKCYCADECLPSGALNVSTCRYGSPSFASLPHFLFADPYYFKNIDGLSPNKTLHNTYIILEPNTGIALEVAARFQINILVQGHNINGNSTLVPIIWFEQTAQISDDLAEKLKLFLFIKIYLPLLIYSLIIFISLFIIYSLIYEKIFNVIIVENSAGGNN